MCLDEQCNYVQRLSELNNKKIGHCIVMTHHSNITNKLRSIIAFKLTVANSFSNISKLEEPYLLRCDAWWSCRNQV
jgi:hypothetical protein